MFSSSKYNYLLPAFLVCVFIYASPCLAVNSSLPQLNTGADALAIKIPGTNFSGFPQINDYINGLYGYTLGVIGMLAIIGIAVGGFMWISSSGNPGKISKAKGWVRDSLLGLVLAFGAYTLLYIINQDLVTRKSLNLGSISQVTAQMEETVEFDGVTLTPDGSESEKNVKPAANDNIKGCYDESLLIPCNFANTGCECVATDPRIAPEVASGLKIVAQIAQNKYGIKLRITSAFRSFKAQNDAWIANNKNPKLAAPPSCNAPHMRGVAVDIWPTVKSRANVIKMQKAFEEAGWTRYGEECWHFQRPGAPANVPWPIGKWTWCKGV
jgi:hypothetical protein